MKRSIIVILVLLIIISGVVIIADMREFSVRDFLKTTIRNLQLHSRIPSLDRPIVNHDPFVEQVAPQLIDTSKQVVEALRRDWTNFDLWMQFGINFKILGDFQGAIKAWEFAALLQPTNPLPFHNLGALYSLELKDAERAETNFVTALRYAGDQVFIYYSAYEFYRYVKKDMPRARAILEDGIAKNPLQAKSLQGALDSIKSL